MTKRKIDAATARPGRYDIMCATLPGFGVRVFPSGRKSFFVYYRLADRTPRRITLGAYGDAMTCEQARRLAAETLLRVRRGEDPAGQRIANRRAPKVGDLLDQYLADHVPTFKPSTRATEKHLIKKHIRPRFGAKGVLAIRRQDIVALKGQMRKTPGAFNKVRDCISRVYHFAERAGGYGVTLDAIPTKGVNRNPAKTIERFLTADERAALEQALALASNRKRNTKGYVSPGACDAIRLLALTGCRRGEIVGLMWEHVDWDRSRVVLPDSKTGPKAVFLSAQALDFLAELSERSDGSPYVCPALNGGRLSNLHRAWRTIRSVAKLKDLRIHDLRHAFASTAVMAGVPLTAVGKLLGHRSPQTTARYAHLADTVLREAAQAVGDAIVNDCASPTSSASQRRPRGARVIAMGARRRRKR